MFKKWIFAWLVAALSMSLLAQPAEKKDIGYLVVVTDSDILLSKKPLPAGGAMVTMKKEDEGADKEKPVPSQEKPQGETPKAGEGDSAKKKPSGNSFALSSGGMFVIDDGGAIYSIRKTSKTVFPKDLEWGAKVFVFYKMEGESKVALRVERAKEN